MSDKRGNIVSEYFEGLVQFIARLCALMSFMMLTGAAFALVTWVALLQFPPEWGLPTTFPVIWGGLTGVLALGKGLWLGVRLKVGTWG